MVVVLSEAEYDVNQSRQHTCYTQLKIARATQESSKPHKMKVLHIHVQMNNNPHEFSSCYVTALQFVPLTLFVATLPSTCDPVEQWRASYEKNVKEEGRGRGATGPHIQRYVQMNNNPNVLSWPCFTALDLYSSFL